MNEFIWNENNMGTWNVNKCKPHEIYFTTVYNTVCKHVKIKQGIPTKVLMLGLGGGYIGALLCDLFDVTVLEVDLDVILKCKKEMFPI